MLVIFAAGAAGSVEGKVQKQRLLAVLGVALTQPA